jgi:hypothetical protein
MGLLPGNELSQHWSRRIPQGFGRIRIDARGELKARHVVEQRRFIAALHGTDCVRGLRGIQIADPD